jgi:hypothetical protein
MPNFTVTIRLRYCRCGALCETTNSRCRKCLDRAFWYRRKAWHCNSPAITPELSRKK